MKVTIVGKGKGWDDAPDDVEIWGVNDLCVRRDVDIIFNMHDLTGKDLSCWEDSVNYAIKNNTPFITLEKLSYIPSSIRYPIEEVHIDYFTNSISYMIAYAIYKEVTEIDLYGCSLLNGTIYTYQKPNIEYWIGYAKGLGIQVNIKSKSNLLKGNDGLLYGYNTKQKDKKWLRK